MAADQIASIRHHLRKVVSGPLAPGVADAELLERFARQGDEAAFELLVWRHERMVWGLCRRVLHDPVDADDAFQAAFLVLARKASAISRRDCVAAWLHRVAYRCALKLRAARARVPRTAEPADLAAVAAAAPGLTEAERRDLGQVLDEEIGRLPERHRAALVLCYLEGKTYQEAADQLGCPLGTLSARVKAARERLREALTARGVTLTTAALAAVLCEQAAHAGAAATLVAAALRAAGQAALPASRAGTLAEGVIRAMSTSKLKLGIAALLAVCVVGLAGAAAAHLFRRDRPPSESPPPSRAEGAPAWQPCAHLGGVVGSQRYMRFSPDSRTLLTVGETWQYQLWDTTTWERRGSYDPRPVFRNTSGLLVEPFSPDSRLLAVSGRVTDREKPGKARHQTVLLDATTLREVARLAGSGPFFAPEGASLVTWENDRVMVWDRRTFTKKHDLRAAAALRGLEMAFTRDGALLFGATMAGRGHLWDLKTGKERARLDGFQPAFAADGKTLLTHLPGGVVKLWGAVTGKERASLRPVEQGGAWGQFTRDGKHVLTTNAWFLLKPNGDPDIPQRNAPVRPHIKALDIRLWDVDGKEIARLSGDDKFGTYARLSPDGKLVGYLRLEPDETERRELVLWDVKANRERTVIRTNKGIHHFEFSPGGDMVLTRDPELAGLRVWDTAKGRRLPDLVTATSLADLHFAASGKLLCAMPGSIGKPVQGPADVMVFRLSDRPLPPPVRRGEPAKPAKPVELPALAKEAEGTRATPALADLEKESMADVQALMKKLEKAKTDAQREPLLAKHSQAEMKRAARAVQIAREAPRDPAALKAMEFVLHRTAGAEEGEVGKVREAALALFRKEFLKSPGLSNVLFFLAAQHTDSADDLLEAIAEGNPDRTVQGRAAARLASELAEKADMARLLRAMPAILKHPLVKDKAKTLIQLARADADALSRRAEKWWGRVKERYADVRTYEGTDKRLGAEAEQGLFALRYLAVGKAAPDIEGADLDGKKFKLSDYKGKVVVLIFCGHWCGPCRQMNPHKQKLVERHARKPFALLEVNSDEDREAVKRTMRKEKLTWRCWFDGGREGPIATRWHVQRWPTILVLDAKGVIRYKELRDDLLDQAVETLLAETTR
jgi:RNA polymerase sigma factor (sigma-70 family)